MRAARMFAVALFVAAASESLAGGSPRPSLVQPSGAEVPANLLRISLVFPAPMAEPVLAHLGLRRASGEMIDQPFLEQELWSPSGKILTILLHPGRVKTGLNAHEKFGPVLTPGESVALTLDGEDVKRWIVSPDDSSGPITSSWHLSPVTSGSKDSLVVELDGPIDGRDVDYLAVVDARDRRVPGDTRLTDGERTWTFTPARPWRAGEYALAVYGNLEDAAGNRLASRFETAEASPPESAGDVAIPFSVTAAKESTAQATSVADRLNFFRWLEDYSDISDEQRAESLFARMKRIPLASEQLYPYLSLGGNYRFRYEHASNQLFGLVSQEDSNVELHRFLLHGDLHLRKSLRAFVQFGGFVETGRAGGPRPTDESQPDIQQAFVDLKLAADFAPLQIRLGRQEITLGTGLHTSVRDGLNQRLSFDAVRGTLWGKAATVDVFYGQEVLPEKRAFRDSAADGSRLWGIYGSKIASLGERAFLDLYYLGLDRDGSVYDQGVGEELRHTLGIRINGARGAWTYDYEGLFQFGTFERQDILAGALLTAHYYAFQTVPWQPRVGLRANFGSGDRDPHDGVLGTFDPLFPNSAYLSEAAVYYPRNLYEVHPVIEVTPNKTVKLSLGVPFVWRFSRDDAVYAVPGVPLVRSDASRGRYTGYLVDLVAQWQPSPHLLIQFSGVHAVAGTAIKDPGGTDLDFLKASVEIRF